MAKRDEYSGITGSVVRKFISKAIASAELGIASVEVEGTTITFTFADDTTAEMTFPTPADGEDGEDGVSIVDVDIDANKHLICTLSDGNTIDAGALPMPSLANYYTKSETDSKFNPRNNFKTINGNSIIGEGDIPVSGGGGGTEVVANPILSGDEETATAIQIGDEKYVFPNTNTYGFTPAQITMFEGILRAGTYSSDQSSAITAFIESLSESPEPTPKVLTSITAVLNNPTVEQGQTYTPNATVTAHYDDSSSAVVTSGVTYSSIDTSTTGEKTLTISYTENEVTKTTTATVTVTAEPVQKVLSSVSATKTKVQYTQNETFSTSDVVVTAHYSDSTTANVTASATIGTVDTSTTGNKTLEISYSEDGATKTTTITITVVEASEKDYVTTEYIEGRRVNNGVMGSHSGSYLCYVPVTAGTTYNSDIIKLLNLGFCESGYVKDKVVSHVVFPYTPETNGWICYMVDATTQINLKVYSGGTVEEGDYQYTDIIGLSDADGTFDWQSGYKFDSTTGELVEDSNSVVSPYIVLDGHAVLELQHSFGSGSHLARYLYNNGEIGSLKEVTVTPSDHTITNARDDINVYRFDAPRYYITNPETFIRR